MIQPPSTPPPFHAVDAGTTGMFSAWFPRHPATSAVQPTICPVGGFQMAVRRRLLSQVVVLEVAGPLRDAVQDLNHAVQVTLADGPRGVVCDLSAVTEGAEPDAVEVLAAVGLHVRDWPGIPVAVASPDPQVRQVLAAHPLGEHLIVTTSMFSAVCAVLATPAPTVEWLHLAPHPTAMRASRDFVTRTLLDWRLGRTIRFARLVVSELVMSSTVNAGTDLDLSIAWNLEALRLTVRDYVPSLPPQEDSTPGLHGRGLALVCGLSRAFGVLPTADGGTVAWAVLDAPEQRLSTSPPLRKPAAALREAPRFTDAVGSGESPFCGETGPLRDGSPAPALDTSSAPAVQAVLRGVTAPAALLETSNQPGRHHLEGVAHVAH